ncbi:MAG: hypothetical protein ACLPHP_13465 [Candidatus Sulfotelmatobacter sp.]
MRSRYAAVSIGIMIAVALAAPQGSFSQYSISTVAGGGPNNLPALQSSIGYPASVARDAANNTYIADAYSSQVFEVSAAGTLTVVAGNGTLGYSGDGGPATSAALNGPESVALDSLANIYIADTNNSVIRVVNTQTSAITVAGVIIQPGTIQTVAGSGTAGYSGDGSLATGAELDDPFGVFVDSHGNIFIADTSNSAIREVVASTGNIQTVAGNGTPCTNQSSFCGDSGPATSAQLALPQGVFVDSLGNIFIADTFNSVIREVTVANGNIQTVAGTYYTFADTCFFSGDGNPATSAQLCLPNGVFLDGTGNIFIADTDNSVIREVTIANGNIQTVAGNNTAGYSGNGGSAILAELNNPAGVFVDSAENIFIADTDNFAIREVTAGNIQALAGNITLAWSGDGGPATDAALNIPGGVFVDALGNLFIADTYNSAIREVPAASINIQTVAGNGVSCAVPSTGCGTALAINAQLNYPGSVFADGSGNIFIADTEDSVIREIVAATGDIQTVAGTPGVACNTQANPGCGDSGPATSAELSSPYAVLLDGSGNIYIADTGNSAVRVVNTGAAQITISGVVIQPGDIQTVAGNGTACTDPSSGCGDSGPAISAELNSPAGISLDAAGDIFIADTFNNAVREVTAATGVIQTVAGTLGTRGYSGDNGPATSALLDTPYGVFVDSFGNIFVADTDNSAIREVVAVNNNSIQTIAGNGTYGFSGDGGSATSAELAHPLGVAGGSAGSLFIADSENSRVRQLLSTVTVALVPASATLPLGGPQQFAATVTGANNPAVTWQVNNVTGGNATVGTISSGGLYQAPAALPTPPTVTVSAISNANGSTSGSASVTVAASGTPTVSVTSTPSGVTNVYTGAAQTFNASVTGETNTAVNWQVNDATGGNATVGTISTAGVYTGPAVVPSPALVVITAVSQASASVSGSYPITIVTAPAAPSPAPQTISPGSAANYSLSLNAHTGNPSQPITLSCLQSSLPVGATCVFSPSIITPGPAAVPFSLKINVPAGEAALQKPARDWLASQMYFAVMPLAGILLMSGTLISGKPRRRSRRWLWLLSLCVVLVALNACGGSSTNTTGKNPELGNYTIQVLGTTAAQPTPTPISTASLTVQ